MDELHRGIMKRLGKWLRGLIRVALLLLAIGFVIQQVVAPAILRRAIVNQLAEFGLTSARVQVDKVSLWDIHLSDLAIGEDERLTVAAIRLKFSPRLLQQRRVDQVMIDAPRWRISLRDGKLDLAPLSSLLSQDTASPGASAKGATSELPFRKLELRSGQLDLDMHGYRVIVPFDASLQTHSPQQWDIDCQTQLAGLPVRVQGRIDPNLLTNPPTEQTNPLQLRVHLAKSVWELQGSVLSHDHTKLQLTLQRAGDTSQSPVPLCQVRYERDRSQGTVTLAVNPPAWSGQWNLWGHRLQGRDVTGALAMTVSDRGRLHGLQLSLQAQFLAWEDYALRDLKVDLSQTNQQVRLNAQATGPNWSIPNLELQTPGWGDLPAGPLRVRGELACQLSQLPPSWALDLLSQAGMTMDRMDRLALDIKGTFRRGESRPPGSPESSENPVIDSLSQDANSATTAWALRLDHLRLNLKNLDLQLTSPYLQVAGLSTDLQLTGTVMPGAWRIQLLEPLTVAWSALQTQQADQSFTLSPARVRLSPRNKLDLVRYVAAKSRRTGAVWALAGDLELSTPVQVQSPDIQVDLAAMSLGGEATLGSNNGPLVKARALVKLDRLHYQPAKVLLTQLDLDLPVHWDGTPATQSAPVASVAQSATQPALAPAVMAASKPSPTSAGHVKLGQVTIGSLKLPGLQGSADLNNGRTELNLAWPLLWGAEMKAEGFIDWTGEQPQGLVTAVIPPFNLTDPYALGQQLPVLKQLELTGTFGMDAKLRWQDGRLRPTIRLDVKNSRFASASMDTAAEGVDGSITFIRLDPLMTQPNQNITIRNAHSGKLKLTNGQVAFRVESPQSVFIERTLWTWGDSGRFWIHTFRFDPAAPRIDLEVFLENLDIRDLLTLMAQGSVRGQGLIYGRIPISLQPGQTPFIRPGEGFLYAEPGKGWFEIQDRDAINKLLAGSDGSITDTIKLKVVEALSDFEYNSLKLQFFKENNESVLRLEAKGKGRRGDKPLVFDPLTINIRGLEEALDQLISPRKGTQSALDAALDRNLPR